jgi:hypothetical protein
MKGRSMKDVFAIYDLKAEGRERSRWVRIGVAFDNRDGSLSILLDALPLNGRLYVRNRQRDDTENANPESPRPALAAVGERPKS